MREFLKDVWMHGGEESRAITPENITGEKGRAAMSASHLGVGRKGSCCVPLESGETITLADIVMGTDDECDPATSYSVSYALNDALPVLALIALLVKLESRGPVLFTGGLARCAPLRRMLERKTGLEFRSSEHSQTAGALGAAVLGAMKARVRRAIVV